MACLFKFTQNRKTAKGRLFAGCIPIFRANNYKDCILERISERISLSLLASRIAKNPMSLRPRIFLILKKRGRRGDKNASNTSSCPIR